MVENIHDIPNQDILSVMFFMSDYKHHVFTTPRIPYLTTNVSQNEKKPNHVSLTI